MKGSTMLAKMQSLGVMPSFSRPSVSDDNAYAEAFFRHLKYAPSWPRKPFATIEKARAWVERFVSWYNTEHRHSGIQFVTPSERHEGKENAVLEARHELYEQAKARHPERWSRTTRDWTPVGEVALTPAGKAARVAAPMPAVGERLPSPSLADVTSPRRRRLLPVARTIKPHRAQGGSRAAEQARGASEPLTRPSTMGGSTSREASLSSPRGGSAPGGGAA
jgi:hypothetical protein